MYKKIMPYAFVFLSTFITTYPNLALGLLFKVVSFQNYLPLKFAFYSVLVFFGLPIYQKIRQWRSMGLLEGVPIEELLDHLFTFWTFKRDEIELKFGISRSKYATIAKKLDIHWFFVRGENNERVLSNITREYASSILSSPTEPVVVKIINRVIALLDALKPKRNPQESTVQTDWKPIPIWEFGLQWNPIE